MIGNLELLFNNAMNRKKTYLFVGVFVLSGAVLAGFAWKKIDDYRKQIVELSENNAKLRHDAYDLVKDLIYVDIGEEIKTKPILSLRQYVYENSQVGGGDFDYGGNHIQHFRTLRFGEKKQLCGGMAATYIWLLSLYGIPARYVQLAARDYVDGIRKGDIHVTVEVYDQDERRWFVSDPTFNVSFACGSSSVKAGIAELYRCVSKGQKLKVISDGKKYIKGRTVSDYYLPYKDLLYAIRAQEMKIATKEGGAVVLPKVEYPYPGWLEKSVLKYREIQRNERK